MPVVDLIVVNGNIVTMDPARPRAEAMAIRAGRIVALGRSDEMRDLAGAGTRHVDAGGRMVLPGFQDTHIHLQDSGHDYSQAVDLSPAKTVGELQEILRRHAETAGGEWVLGSGWNGGYFSEANLARQVIDAVVPGRPCYITSSDYHNACLNSAGCERLGMTAATPDPPNGHFVRQPDGAPTGLVYEDAMIWIAERMPPVTDADYRQGVLAAQALANRHGLTGVLDASVKERHARVYARLEQAGELSLRIASTARIEPHEQAGEALERVLALRAMHRSDLFKVHSAKFFLDGVFENRTAAMIDAYADDAGGNAPLMFSRDQIMDFFPLFDAARFQLHVHAIGDGAVRAALDGMQEAIRQNGRWPGLHQIAHVQTVHPDDIGRFRALGVMANLQPLWAHVEPSITDLVLPILGPGRAAGLYAFRSLIDAGAPFTLSSDWGVSSLNPFEIMETAVTRQPPGAASHPVLMPEERLTRFEALAGYTVNAARAAWNGELCGALAPGRYADFIIPDRDILACDIYELGRTEVLLTVLEGREVYRSAAFDG